MRTRLWRRRHRRVPQSKRRRRQDDLGAASRRAPGPITEKRVVIDADPAGFSTRLVRAARKKAFARWRDRANVAAGPTISVTWSLAEGVAHLRCWRQNPRAPG